MWRLFAKLRQVLTHWIITCRAYTHDHEQNASTSTVKIAGSSGANPFACVAAGVARHYGDTAHGGANESVIRMLKDDW